jgi:hypothetical protein
MKKLILFSFWMLSVTGFLYMTNCSKPLDSIDNTGHAYFDTLYVADTIIVVDTVVVVDTIVVADSMYCGRLNAQRQEIVWILQGQEGLFFLDFAAITSREGDSRVLIISIDDQQYSWPLDDYLELTLEQDLYENTLITITSEPPHAYGQAVDICMSLRSP